MNRKVKDLKKSSCVYWIPILALILHLFVTVPCISATMEDQRQFEQLKKRLVADGFDEEKINQLYKSTDVFFETRGVTLYFMHSESRLNYNQFTSKKLIKKARKYMDRHKDAFARAEKNFGVDKEVITAIILVETKFGTYLGSKSIINSLSTMAALSDKGPREYLWNRIPSDRRITREKFDKKADQKANWAYKELKAFLTYTERENIEPVDVIGSYAGAMGIAQFMPSNALTIAKDGNDDGQVDLFNHDDAISSIASYLKRYGWKPGIDKDKAYKVVYHYNHSKYYVKTVLKITDLLKG